MSVGTGDVLDGRYELLERIGRGGMGSVYRAYDDRLGREVAVKVLDGAFGGDAEFLARFQREARAAASLSHPGIVAVHDRGEHDGTHFIVMELIDGPTLADVVRTQGPLDPARVLAVGAVIADALGAAHRLGLVHRDVKPGNVLVTPDGHVKVTDFGIARAVADATITTADSVLGSVPYVAPEQVRGEPATPAADVYALGCLLYALLTGQPPFRAETAVSVLHQHISQDPEPPSTVVPQIPPEADQVVLRMLAKDPLDRPADGARAAVLLRHAAGSAPEVAPVLAPDLLERTRVMAHVDETRVLATGRTRVDLGDDGSDEQESPAFSLGRRLGLLAALVALVVLVALFGERIGGDEDGGAAPATSAPSATSTQPAPSDPPSAEPTPTPSADTLEDVVDRIGEMLSSGRGASMSNSAVDRLSDRLFKVVKAYTDEDWADARKKADELRAEVTKQVDRGDVTPEQGGSLIEQIVGLQRLLLDRPA